MRMSLGMVEGGSPFPNTNLTMPSPGARNWPGSPSMPGPSPASRHMVHSPGYQALHSPQKEGTSLCCDAILIALFFLFDNDVLPFW